MRSLFTTSGGYGHFLPLVPLAEALRAAGHEVAFGAPVSFTSVVEGAGFDVFPLDEPEAPSTLTGPAGPTPSDRSKAAVARYLGQAAAQTPGLVAAAERWQPDVLVRETTAWSAWLTGELLDLPVAVLDFEPTPPLVLAMSLGREFQAARAAVGLPPDQRLRGLNRWLHLLAAPPGWFAPNAFGATSHLFQPPPDPAPRGGHEALWSPGPDRARPLVYVSLGTKFNQARDVFEAVFGALADQPVDVLATLGPGLTADSFGTLPANVRVEQFIPQSLVVPHADLVVCHGGYGSVMSALCAGKPVVAVPLGNADGPANAQRVEALGVGRAIVGGEITTARVREAVLPVLTDQRYRTAAERLAGQIRELPPLSDAAALVEALATRPVPAGPVVSRAR